MNLTTHMRCGRDSLGLFNSTHTGERERDTGCEVFHYIKEAVCVAGGKVERKWENFPFPLRLRFCFCCFPLGNFKLSLKGFLCFFRVRVEFYYAVSAAWNLSNLFSFFRFLRVYIFFFQNKFSLPFVSEAFSLLLAEKPRNFVLFCSEILQDRY